MTHHRRRRDERKPQGTEKSEPESRVHLPQLHRRDKRAKDGLQATLKVRMNVTEKEEQERAGRLAIVQRASGLCADERQFETGPRMQYVVVRASMAVKVGGHDGAYGPLSQALSGQVPLDKMHDM